MISAFWSFLISNAFLILNLSTRIVYKNDTRISRKNYYIIPHLFDLSLHTIIFLWSWTNKFYFVEVDIEQPSWNHASFNKLICNIADYGEHFNGNISINFSSANYWVWSKLWPYRIWSSNSFKTIPVRILIILHSLLNEIPKTSSQTLCILTFLFERAWLHYHGRRIVIWMQASSQLSVPGIHERRRTSCQRNSALGRRHWHCKI